MPYLIAEEGVPLSIVLTGSSQFVVQFSEEYYYRGRINPYDYSFAPTIGFYRSMPCSSIEKSIRNEMDSNRAKNIILSSMLDVVCPDKQENLGEYLKAFFRSGVSGKDLPNRIQSIALSPKSESLISKTAPILSEACSKGSLSPEECSSIMLAIIGKEAE